MLQRMDARVRRFIATGAKVVLLLEPAQAQESVSTGAEAMDHDYEQLNNLLRTVALQFPKHVALVDLAGRVCPSGPPCHSVVRGVWVRPDNIHYGAPGSLWVAKWLVPQIVRAADSLH